MPLSKKTIKKKEVEVGLLILSINHGILISISSPLIIKSDNEL